MSTYPVSPDYAAQQGALFAQQVKAEVDRLNGQYKSQLDEEIRNITAELKRNATLQIRSIVLPVIAAIVAAFALLVYAQTRSLNNTYIDFQNGVMALQKEVLATSNGLGEKASLVAAADKELDAATRRLENTTTEYQGRLQTLAGAQKELDAATRRLENTTTEYQGRLQALAGAQKETDAATKRLQKLADDYEARLKKSAPATTK